ncbi:chemotaxis protein CheW [Imhoffiella purpurea]|uniref:Positive regulator of CheA protein activity (CheW) n=1 Tax=Imhoffiella purpurea TaxID=1249627 RepID=W9VFY4_9GAMM|nr:chemotaxis protein CheW [Imhoffiella purpurea]EXJ14947.1 Positive regulator of CheA protein activity (CheW) [Imhoffiella purpurea]
MASKDPNTRSGPIDVEEEGTSQYLTFTVAGQMFGIGILAIKEIIQYGAVSSVPMMPDFIRGVINLRGAVVPVVDLSARFHGRAAEAGRRSCIVIVEMNEEGSVQDVGILVDSVSAVLEISPEEIEPPPAFGAGIKSDFIRGMGKVDGRFVILLDVSRVLGTEGLIGLVSPAIAAVSNRAASSG